MNLNIRARIFWGLDVLRKSPIKKRLYKISKINDGDTYEAYHKAELHLLLKHAKTTTAYYENIETLDVLDYPVVNKNIIRDNLALFLSKSFTTKTRKKIFTSGSTGTPFYVYQDHNKVLHNIADNIYFYSKSGYTIGEKLIYIKIWPDVLKFKLKLNLFVKNIRPINVYNLEFKDILYHIKKLNSSNNSASIVSYVSVFKKMFRYLDKLPHNPITFKPKTIITISEALTDDIRKQIEAYFKVKPLSRYSNNENGIIAQQTVLSGTKFKINHSSYFIEILDLKTDVRLEHGNLGRIILTDLKNYATPLIRYDTGDIGVMELDAHGVPYLSKVLGRKIDALYDTNGKIVSSHIAYKLFKYGDFKQLQFVQKTKKEYHVNLNTSEKVDENAIAVEFKNYLGDDAVIKVNYVDEIPLLSSGKRRQIVNEYYKD